METPSIQKKKILYVITKSNWGGAQRYVFDLANNLKNTHEIVVAAGGHGLLAEKLEECGITYIEIPALERDIHIGKEFATLRTLRNIYKREQPDIVHLNSSKIGGLGSLAARLERVPKIIFTAHGWAFNENQSFVWKTFVYLSSWITALLCHHIITLSYKEEAQATQFPLLKPNRISMIYLGTHTTKSMSREDACSLISQQLGVSISEKTLWIGSIGELHANKGYEYALQACAALKQEGRDFVYMIIGDGEKKRELKKQIAEKGLEKHVYLVGAIPTPETGSSLLSAFDIYLLPSTKEGLPYVLLEAGVQHLPVIASAVGGIPEIITHEKNGLLLRPGNILDIKENIDTLFFDKKTRTQYGSALHATITSKFSLESMVGQTAALYEN